MAISKKRGESMAKQLLVMVEMACGSIPNYLMVV